MGAHVPVPTPSTQSVTRRLSLRPCYGISAKSTAQHPLPCLSACVNGQEHPAPRRTQCDVTASVTDGTHTDRAAHHASACTCHNIVQSTYLLSQRHNYSLTLDSRGIGLWGSLHDGEKPGMPLSRSIKFDFSAFFWCHHKQNKYNNPFLKILRYVVPQRM